jgi:hypothetical protein
LTAELSGRRLLGIAAIFKNEGPYILEWLAFHRVVGVGRFFIADNDSDDGTTELLEALQSAGLVDRMPFPTVAGSPPQLLAYDALMSRHRNEVDWVAFIDADEFMMPADGRDSIRSVFQAVKHDVGAVALNWAIYGSSNRLRPYRGLVIERFTRRAQQMVSMNCHYKTVVRAQAYVSHHDNPHRFRIGRGYRYAHADGGIVEDHPKYGLGLSRAVTWRPVRINHYVIKSRAEFDRKKVPRGRATILTSTRDAAFFRGHDRNEESDPVPRHLVEATRAEMERIRAVLRARGVPEDIVRLDETVSALEPLADTGLGRGEIEQAYLEDGRVVLKGWALTSANRPAGAISLHVYGQAVNPLTAERQKRPDIVARNPGASEESGFLLSCEPAKLASVPETAVEVRIGGDGALALGLPPGISWPTLPCGSASPGGRGSRAGEIAAARRPGL